MKLVGAVAIIGALIISGATIADSLAVQTDCI
jgi:hypothetical protein